MPQLEHIEAIEKRLWSAADNLRANSNYASNEYFLPVMGLNAGEMCWRGRSQYQPTRSSDFFS